MVAAWTVLASKLAQEVDQALYIIGGAGVLLLAGITAAMVYFVVRYRHRRSPTALQIEGSTTLEIVWTVIPTIIVIGMFYVGYRGFLTIRDIPQDARLVRVIGQKWSWLYEYPAEKISSGEFVLPAGEPCRLELTSRDVIHSFYLPDFRVKEDCVPGRVNQMWIDPERVGAFNVFCAEFCGRDHAQMVSLLRVVSTEDYARWVEEKLGERYRPIDIQKALDPASVVITKRDAPQLYATYCASCHGPDGRGGLVAGARSFTTLQGWKRGPKLTDIFVTLSEGIEGTQMRAFANLPPIDRFALAHHVATFYTGSEKRPEPTEDDKDAVVADYELEKNQMPPKRLPIDEAIRQIAAEAATAPDAQPK
jgi:cytochrome c oxidase subunit 2